MVLKDAVDQAADCVTQLGLHGFTMSSKSTMIASDMQLAAEIQSQLAARWASIQISDCGRDVRVDFAAGSRRRVRIQRTRTTAVKSGVKTVLQLNRTVKNARKLVFTGVKPRAWGFSAMGCTPTLAKSLKGSIVKGLGIRKAGGCVGTALAMFGYATRDPLSHIQH